VSETEYQVNYKIFVTKSARKHGRKLGISKPALKEVIEQVKRLKHWPDNENEFTYEMAFGAIKFSFDFVEGHWIRVYVFKDDFRKFMWVIRVTNKKTNALTTADRISVETAVSEIKREVDFLKRQQLKQEAQPILKSLKGGKSE